MNDEVNNTGQGNEAGVEGGIPPAAAPPADFKIPEQFANHAAFEGIKDLDGLCNKMVNQESLIGKKYIGIPDEKSSAEDIQKYREAIGVPITFEGYQLETSPEIKQLYGEEDQKVLGEFKELMHTAGLSQNQANQMKQGYDKIVGSVLEQRKQYQDNLNAEFEKMISESFGSEKEQKLEIAKGVLDKFVSEKTKQFLPHVLEDNKALLVIADMANNIYPELSAEDLRSQFSTGSGAGNVSDIKAEMNKIIASDEFRNQWHPGNEDAKKKLQEMAKKYEEANKK